MLLRDVSRKFFVAKVFSYTVVDVRMSVVKPLSANWMIKLYDYMKSNPTIVSNGFAAAGITFDD